MQIFLVVSMLSACEGIPWKQSSETETLWSQHKLDIVALPACHVSLFPLLSFPFFLPLLPLLSFHFFLSFPFTSSFHFLSDWWPQVIPNQLSIRIRHTPQARKIFTHFKVCSWLSLTHTWLHLPLCHLGCHLMNTCWV